MEPIEQSVEVPHPVGAVRDFWYRYAEEHGERSTRVHFEPIGTSHTRVRIRADEQPQDSKEESAQRVRLAAQAFQAYAEGRGQEAAGLGGAAAAGNPGARGAAPGAAGGAMPGSTGGTPGAGGGKPGTTPGGAPSGGKL